MSLDDKLNIMYQPKLHFLLEQNVTLRKDRDELFKIYNFDKLTQTAQASTLYQLKEENTTLRNKIQELNCKLLMEKEAKTMEIVNLNTEIDMLNRKIFQMRKEIIALQECIRALQKGAIKRRSLSSYLCSIKEDKPANDFYYDFQNPVVTYELLEQLINLSTQEGEQDTQSELKQQVELQEDDPIDTSKHFNTIPSRRQEDEKWYADKSSIYFLKHHLRQDMMLKLQSVKKNNSKQLHKQVSLQQVAAMNDPALLRACYLRLVCQQQVSQRKLRLYSGYITQLQARNELILSRFTGQE